MNGKKILFILDHLKGGGAERIALEVAESFYNNGYDVVIALLDDKETRMLVPDYIKKINIDLDPIFYSGKFWRNRKRKFLSKDKKKIREIVDKINPNLIILSHSYAHLIIPMFKKNENVWSWIHSEVMPPPRKKTTTLFYWYKEERRYYLDHGSFVSIFNKKNIITVNEHLKTSYQTHLPKSKIVVIPNGVNSKRVLKDISLNSNIIWNCIFVGRLSLEKQPEHAIKAFARSGLGGRMAIVGDGIMENDIRNLCYELQISDRVDFLGWQKYPSEFISKSKCLVLSSSIEGSPLIIAETLILGVPVVSYQINSGVEQMLNHNELKRGLVENQNIEALGNKIYEIVKNPYNISQEDKSRVSLINMMKSFEKLL